MDTRKCDRCGEGYPLTRRDRKFCTPKCRSRFGQEQTRRKTPVNSKTSKAKYRANLELFDSVISLTERYYTAPRADRLGQLQTLVALARAGDTRTRAVLANPYLINVTDKYLKSLLERYRYPQTIGAIVDKYCRHFWKASGRDVVNGTAPEPPTGEVLPVEQEREVRVA